MGERLEWIVDEQRFAAIGPEWNDLADAQGRPFSEHEWFTHWWTAFGTGRSLNVCVLWDQGRLCAAMPLSKHAGVVESLANDHTPVFTPLARSSTDLRTLTEAVVAESGASLSVSCLAAGEEAQSELTRASRHARRWLLVRPMHTSPIVETTGSLSDFLSRPGLRGQLPRYRRKMAREYDASIDVMLRVRVPRR